MDIKIAGLQPLTLLDYPGKIAATIFLPGCNFNCPYCHNSELNTKNVHLINTDEILYFLNERKNKLQGIVISGGEPTMQDITPLLQYAKNLGYSTKVDTNGTHPQSIQHWTNKHLIDYIAMDIKNDVKNYTETTGFIKPIDLSPILESINIIMNIVPDYEFRTTVVEPYHTIESIEEIAYDMIYHAKRYYLQPFVDRDTVPYHNLSAPSNKTLQIMKSVAEQYIQHVEIRNLN